MKTTCKKIYKFVTVLLEMFVSVLSVTLFSSFGVGRSFKNIQKTLFLIMMFIFYVMGLH